MITTKGGSGERWRAKLDYGLAMATERERERESIFTMSCKL